MMALRRPSKVLKLAAGAVAGALVLAGCAGGEAAGGKKSYNIAVMLWNTSSELENAELRGAEAEAKKLGNVQITSFDGQGKSDVQFGQIQNIAQSGKYDAIYVEPVDGVSLAGAFPLANNIPVVAFNTPIGQDFSNMKPQVDGVIQTIADSPADLAAAQAKYVADYCAKINPCKVAAMVGDLSTPLDVSRMAAYKRVLGQHSNIKIVAETQGLWDRDKSLQAMANVVQANPDLNAVVTPGDQMTYGVTIALKNAGIDPSKLYIASLGGSEDGIKAVRDGMWQLTGIYLPTTAGETGIRSLVDHLEGKPVAESVSFTKLDPTLGFWVTKADLAKIPDFTGQWNG